MKPTEVISQLFGEYVSRTEGNLIKRCEELGWGVQGWEKIKQSGWVEPVMGNLQGKIYRTGHYQRVCSSVLKKMSNDISNRPSN